MNLRKAVITAAGQNQHTLPLQNLIDTDGIQKSALRIILEETLSAGIEEICLVIFPGDEESYRKAAGNLPAKLHFIEQKEPRGYGHALLCARDFAGSDPFLHLVSDHLYLSHGLKRCAELLAEVAKSHACAVSAVQATRETMLPYYGAVGGKGLPGQARLYVIDDVVEKPTPTEAEEHLIVPGLRAAHYLCFFGIHVLTGAVMPILAEKDRQSGGSGIHLSSALRELASVERYLAFELPGRRYNMGVKFGTLIAQFALGLSGREREEVLSQLLEVLASRAVDSPACPAA